MKLPECAICGKKHDLFPIDIPGDEPDWPKTRRYVCGKCWETIAEIARRAVERKAEAANG